MTGGRQRSAGRTRTLPILALALLFASSWVADDSLAQSSAPPEWISVDYSELVDRRQLSHSGAPVGILLAKLGGRPVPRPGGSPEDRTSHSLLDPLIEPYGFILSDALDVLSPPATPLIDVGSLWEPGGAEPAWVELVRARRLVVESDGHGYFRVALPLDGEDPEYQPDPESSAETARRAYQRAWPILRQLFAAERLRRQADGEPPVTLHVEAYAYQHLPARSIFLLGSTAHRAVVDDTRSLGRRPPLDLGPWQAFLDQGLTLEGARLERGVVQLFGSPAAERPTLLGRPITLADFAVAYRAVYHGGLAEPYMSLDQGYSPQQAIVNYGGRLRDTAIGMVSLMCDIRFKTFSLGLDIVEGIDRRAELRQALPAFKSHMEHFAADVTSGGVLSQQTRLWFYPDKVDLTVSPQGDVLAMRRVRMSAASEGLNLSAPAADRSVAPWTGATVDAINQNYDTLVRFFPELGDLDRVVRLLSLFTWLRQAERSGLPVPELDALLSVELPQRPTPRSFPQMLAYNALPPAGQSGAVDAFDRVPVAVALERLKPPSGKPLPARERAERAMGALDTRHPDNAKLVQDYRAAQALDESTLDQLAYRAERLRMHQTVLATLDRNTRRQLSERQDREGPLRAFSVAIGGLDLGMGKALAKASSRSLSLTGFGSSVQAGQDAGAPASRSTSPVATGRPARVEAWRREVANVAPLPDHGLGESATEARHGEQRIETGSIPATGGNPAGRWVWTLGNSDSSEVRSRKVSFDGQGRPILVERTEQLRTLVYRLEIQQAGRLVARRLPDRESAPADTTTDALSGATLPDGLATLAVGPGEDPSAIVTPKLRLRLSAAGVRPLETLFPRLFLQRLVLGHEADSARGQPLPGLAPLPPNLGAVRTLMVLADSAETSPPWDRAISNVAGEESSARIARALNAWWRGAAQDPETSAVVGVDPSSSPERWSRAPRIRASELLIDDADFPGLAREWSGRLRELWTAGRPASDLPADSAADLVVWISAEAPGVFAAHLRELARDPAMDGKLLAAWCLSGELRQDLAASLIAEGHLAGLGLAGTSMVGRRDAGRQIAALSSALAAGGTARRAEELPGPFLWYF